MPMPSINRPGKSARTAAVAAAVSAGDPADGRVVLVDDLHERGGELGRVAFLLAVHRLPPGAVLGPALGIVVDRELGERCRGTLEEFGAEEARLDEGRLDPEWSD